MRRKKAVDCDHDIAVFPRVGAHGIRLARDGVVIATVFLCGLIARDAEAGKIDVAVTGEQVIVDDSDPRFLGGEIRAPQFCPYDTNWLCFEVRKEQAFRLYLYNREKAQITEIQPGQQGASGRIGSRSSGGGSIQCTDFDWRPVAGPGGGERWYVFSSDASGTFDLWLAEAVSGKMVRIPSKNEAKNERGPHWSPDGELLAYWSDAAGEGDIYLLKYVRDVLSSDTTKRLQDPLWLVRSSGLDYEVRWYPGPKSGYLAYTHQDPGAQASRRVQIRVCDIFEDLEKRIDSIQDAKPSTYLRSASWDPAGQGDLAFYQTNEFPGPGKDVSWGVGIASAELDKGEGGRLTLKLKRPRGLSPELEASVQPSYDLRFGPVWTPDGSLMALTRKYEDKDEDLKDPLWLYNVRAWEYGNRYRSDVSFAPAFKFPRDVTIQGNQIAFVYVDGVSRKLLTARLKGRDFDVPKPVVTWPLVTESRIKKYQWMYDPDHRPGFLSKVWYWASQPLFRPNVGLNSRGMAILVPAGVITYLLLRPHDKTVVEQWNPPGFGE